MEDLALGARGAADTIFSGRSALVFSDLIFCSLTLRCSTGWDAVLCEVAFGVVIATLPCLFGPKAGRFPERSFETLRRVALRTCGREINSRSFARRDLSIRLGFGRRFGVHDLPW
jgi:hypothetical protein